MDYLDKEVIPDFLGGECVVSVKLRSWAVASGGVRDCWGRAAEVQRGWSGVFCRVGVGVGSSGTWRGHAFSFGGQGLF